MANNSAANATLYYENYFKIKDERNLKTCDKIVAYDGKSFWCGTVNYKDARYAESDSGKTSDSCGNEFGG